jgi:hypothetical protein
MAGQGYASRQEAIVAAQKDMRATFGKEIRFEQSGDVFRVLDSAGRHLETFAVFQFDGGTWSWAEGTPRG